MAALMEEVNGWKIGYYRYGTGPKPMLLMSGALGTSQTDFYEQLEGDDAFDMNQWTIIATESPGWGRSRPPERPYGAEVYTNDVECFYGLMKKLGYERFYVVGWSDGGIVGLAMAAMYPNSIIAMVQHGLLVTLWPQTLAVLKATRNVETWPKERLDRLLMVYDSKATIQKLWDRHLKFCDYFQSYYPHDKKADQYKIMKFPYLLIHGGKDPISHIEHPQYVMKHLPHAKFHCFPNGSHDLHMRYTASYKKIVESFLLTGEYNT